MDSETNFYALAKAQLIKTLIFRPELKIFFCSMVTKSKMFEENISENWASEFLCLNEGHKATIKSQIGCRSADSMVTELL